MVNTSLYICLLFYSSGWLEFLYDKKEDDGLSQFIVLQKWQFLFSKDKLRK